MVDCTCQIAPFPSHQQGRRRTSPVGSTMTARALSLNIAPPALVEGHRGDARQDTFATSALSVCPETFQRGNRHFRVVSNASFPREIAPDGVYAGSKTQ